MVNTIASVLTQKGAVVWFLPPGASVYEAIEKMAEKGGGAAASELHHRQVPCLRPRGRRTVHRSCASTGTSSEVVSHAAQLLRWF